MAGKKLMTVVLGILAVAFSPVIILVSASIGAALMFLLCPRTRATTDNCEFCYSALCPEAVMVITLALFPLILIVIGILWYRRAVR